MPLARRLPKRGFHNIFAKPLESINVSALEKFEDGAVVNAQALLEKGILLQVPVRRQDPGQRQSDQEAACPGFRLLRFREGEDRRGWRKV